MSLRVELAFLPLWCRYPHNSRSISLSLCCIKSAFPAISPQKDSFWIVSCAMLPTLGPFLPPRHSCHYSLDDVILWIALSICHICLPEVAKGSFQSIDHCILCWTCCWARCWMLQGMDHMEASYIFYVKVGRLVRFEQSKIRVLTVTSLGIVMLTLHYDLMVSMGFM